MLGTFSYTKGHISILYVGCRKFPTNRFVKNLCYKFPTNRFVKNLCYTYIYIYIYIGLIIVFVRTQSHIKKMIGTYRADGWYIKELVDVKFILISYYVRLSFIIDYRKLEL